MSTQPRKLVGREQMKDDKVGCALKKAKGEILKEFEKVCPTDKSFDRVLKEMHDIFDQLQTEMKELV